MASKWKSRILTAALILSGMSSAYARPNDDDQRDGDQPKIRHVLMISVDGMHALDLKTYVDAHPDSTLAKLSEHGITYTNNSTSSPSDSFPGLATLVTGGSPVTAGLWYDDTFNRKLSPPIMTDGLGDPGGSCPSTGGTIVAWDESVDYDLTQLNGGGGINPNFVVRDPNNNCVGLMPHQYLRVNTVFEVVKAHGGYTAWTDKHPSYEWTNGPSGKGVDDFYGPEINSIPVALPQFPGCSPVPFVDTGYDDGWTTDLHNIQCYDSLHVQAVLNQIDGYTHDRSQKAPVPAIFGTNFQSVSVGEKLVTAGYTDVLGTPSAGLEGEFDYIDQSLGKFVSELKEKHLYDSTLIIVAAKHGQSPIDASKNHNIGNGQPGATVGSAEAYDSSDDGSLIWLTDPSLTESVVATLSTPTNQAALGIQEIFALDSLYDKFNVPGSTAGTDPRTPDIILKVNTGVIFTGSTAKFAEHGGFNEDDIHTALLVSHPSLEQKTVKAVTSNQQVPATILKVLGIDPDELQAVKKESIHVLPFLFDGDSDSK